MQFDNAHAVPLILVIFHKQKHSRNFYLEAHRYINENEITVTSLKLQLVSTRLESRL